MEFNKRDEYSKDLFNFIAFIITLTCICFFVVYFVRWNLQKYKKGLIRKEENISDIHNLEEGQESKKCNEEIELSHLPLNIQNQVIFCLKNVEKFFSR
jgi:hypothetical protein